MSSPRVSVAALGKGNLVIFSTRFFSGQNFSASLMESINGSIISDYKEDRLRW